MATTKKKKVRKIRKQGTRELSEAEHAQLTVFLSKHSVYRASRKCGVSDDVLIRMRDKNGTFHKSSISKVLGGILSVEAARSGNGESLLNVTLGRVSPEDRVAEILDDVASEEDEQPEDQELNYVMEMSRQIAGACNEVTRTRLGKELLRYAQKLRPAAVEEVRVSEPVSEAVDHPEHYGGKANPYEAIKVIEAWDLNFNLGNAAKYISRAGRKGCRKEDLEKALWYLNRELSR